MVDVRIKAGRVVALGEGLGAGASEIDATGKIVTIGGGAIDPTYKIYED